MNVKVNKYLAKPSLRLYIIFFILLLVVIINFLIIKDTKQIEKNIKRMRAQTIEMNDLILLSKNSYFSLNDKFQKSTDGSYVYITTSEGDAKNYFTDLLTFGEVTLKTTEKEFLIIFKPNNKVL